MIWLRRDLAVNHPYAIDKMMTGAGMVIPPEEGFLPGVVVAEMNIAEYIALGITDNLAAKILGRL